MEFTTNDLKSLFADLSAKMTRERDALCALDGVIGDADHGIAMEQGMSAAAAATAAVDNGTLQDIFNAGAKAFLNAVGASSVPLYATALLRAGKSAGPVTLMPSDGLRSVIAAMAEGIEQRGKGAAGQKTMLDAWLPAAEAAGNGARRPPRLRLRRNAVPIRRRTWWRLWAGRRRLGERSLGHPDPARCRPQ